MVVNIDDGVWRGCRDIIGLGRNVDLGHDAHNLALVMVVVLVWLRLSQRRDTRDAEKAGLHLGKLLVCRVLC